jgi:AhpD family alkylhydroperoxidase
MHDLSPRMVFAAFTETAGGAAAALQALGKAVDASGLDKTLTELVKLRASQINGCAFCVQFHLNLARKLGVAPVKLDLAAVWRDAPVFTPRERAALAWTEALTGLARATGHGVEDHEYDAVREQFSAAEVAFLTAAIANIQAWNRIAVALRFAPQVPAA